MKYTRGICKDRIRLEALQMPGWGGGGGGDSNIKKGRDARRLA